MTQSKKTGEQKSESIGELIAKIAHLEAELAHMKSAERDLRQTETRYKALFEYMLNGVGIYRPIEGGKDFILVDLNKAAERVEKVRKHKVLGKSISQVFPGIKAFGLIDVFREVLNTGRPIDHPVTRYKDDRLEGWRDHFVYRLPSGEIVTVYSDETNRKQAEEALRLSEERFRTLVENSPDYIFIKDAYRKYTYVNPSMETLLGRKASEIVGRNEEDFYGEGASSRIRELDLRVLRGESIEEEHTRPIEGVYLTFHDIRVPLRSDDGEVIGIYGISRNITERRKASEPTSIALADYPSEVMRTTLNKASFAATSDGIILLQGESGSGKDWLARWIHDHSNRAEGPFFAINCAAISPELAESELFGHEQGAFTGARGKKRGLLELAEGGTILLNEIGELALGLQSKLLAFLDSRSFLRVGGEKSIHVDARLIAATHRDLEQEVDGGRFLQALYYRLSVFPIRVPPLRERSEDIEIIAQEIMAKLASEMQLPDVPVLDGSDVAALRRYTWPGNVRELRNILERSLILSGQGRFKLWLSPSDESYGHWALKVEFPHGKTLRQINDGVTEALCVEALRRTRGNQKEAARLLGISRDSIHRFARRFGFKRENLTQNER
ncbi:MAG: PAS domain S-box protein [Deltaproteobacteria bacterium]|nr:PAS domain S-box protein [Deltaproteobacteria bacterium]